MLAIVKVLAVAPSISAHMPPPFVESSHCTVGVGVPDAAAEKLAACPVSTVWLAGCLVTFGGVSPVSGVAAPGVRAVAAVGAASEAMNNASTEIASRQRPSGAGRPCRAAVAIRLPSPFPAIVAPWSSVGGHRPPVSAFLATAPPLGGRISCTLGRSWWPARGS